MPDNVVSNPGSGGVTWATKDASGVHHAKHLLEFDVAGTPTLVAVGAPLPIRMSDGSGYLSIATGDMDTGGPTDTRILFGIALPGSGGAVVGGTSTNPLRTDPTGTTTQPVEGELAHDDSINTATNKVILVAGRANLNEPAVVAAGDAVLPWNDLQGRQVAVLNQPAKPAAASERGPTSGSTGTSGDNTAIAAPGAGSIVVTGIVATNSNAATAVQASFKDGAGGTEGLKGWLGADGKTVLAMQYNPPWKLTATTALILNLSASVANVVWTVHYYVEP